MQTLVSWFAFAPANTFGNDEQQQSAAHCTTLKKQSATAGSFLFQGLNLGTPAVPASLILSKLEAIEAEFSLRGLE